MKCEFCDKKYIGGSSKINLETHLIHCDLNPNGIKYRCDKCNKEFEKRHSLIGHKRHCGKIYSKRIRKKKPYKSICKYCQLEESNPYKLGAHMVWCSKNPNIDNQKLKSKLTGSGRKHTEETKRKISEARKEFLLKNPDKVPYLLNHSSKESYPEQYFNDVFTKEEMIFERYLRIGTYQLDFAIPDKKIDIEIDGGQHIHDMNIVKSDDKRNNFLEENGWDIIRINWTNYKQMKFEDKCLYIQDLKNYINKICNSKPTIKFLNRRICECGSPKYKLSKNCKSCFYKKKFKAK